MKRLNQSLKSTFLPLLCNKDINELSKQESNSLYSIKRKEYEKTYRKGDVGAMMDEYERGGGGAKGTDNKSSFCGRLIRYLKRYPGCYTDTYKQ